MFSAGLLVILLACTLLLSSLQGWALRGRGSLPRHLVAWLAGTALVSAVLVATWGVALGVRGPTPRPHVALVLDAVVALGVAAALGAGAMHARLVHGRMLQARRTGAHPRAVARNAWFGRAAVQGVTLCVVGGVGAVALLLVAIGR